MTVESEEMNERCLPREARKTSGEHFGSLFFSCVFFVLLGMRCCEPCFFSVCLAVVLVKIRPDSSMDVQSCRNTCSPVLGPRGGTGKRAAQMTAEDGQRANLAKATHTDENCHRLEKQTCTCA